MITIGVLFFIFGFVTWLNGPLITFVKLAFNLDDVNAFLVPMAFYLSYFFLALPASWILRRTGMKRGMALGAARHGARRCGVRSFHDYARLSWHVDRAVHDWRRIVAVADRVEPVHFIVGPIESAAQRIAFMGICNKFAGMLAPLVFGALVLQGLDNFDARVKAAADPQARDALLNAFAAQVYWPYMIMAGLLALLAAWITRSSLPDVQPEAVNERADGDGKGISSFPHLWLGVACLFLYVGVEVLAGDAIGIYGAGFDLPLDATRLFTSYTLAAMLIGYVAGLLLIPRFVSQERYLAISAALGVLLSIGAYLTTGIYFGRFYCGARICQCHDVAGHLSRSPFGALGGTRRPARRCSSWPSPAGRCCLTRLRF